MKLKKYILVWVIGSVMMPISIFAFDDKKACNHIYKLGVHKNKAGWVQLHNKTPYFLKLKSKYAVQGYPPEVVAPGETVRYEALSGNRYQDEVHPVSVVYTVMSVDGIPGNDLDFTILNSRHSVYIPASAQPLWAVFPGERTSLNQGHNESLYGSSGYDINDAFIQSGIYMVGGFDGVSGRDPQNTGHDDNFDVTIAQLPMACENLTKDTYVYMPSGKVSDGTGFGASYKINSCDVFTNSSQKSGDSPFYCTYKG